MRSRICKQCAKKEERAGCLVCFDKGHSMKECKNFSPLEGTKMARKFKRLGK
jgi:hypothetical protein